MARSGAPRRSAIQTRLPVFTRVYTGKLKLTWCAVPSAVLASRSPLAPKPPLRFLRCNTTQTGGRETRARPEYVARGGRQGRRGEPRAGLPLAIPPRRTALFGCLSRRLTSPLEPTNKSPIMATRPRPPSSQQPRRPVRPSWDAGRPLLVAADAEPRENFTGMSPAGPTCSRLTENTTTVMAAPRPPRRNLRARGIARSIGANQVH